MEGEEMTFFPLMGVTFAVLLVACLAGAAFLLRRARTLSVSTGRSTSLSEERDPSRTVKRQSAALLFVSVALAALGLLVFYLLVSVLPLLGLV
jgi:hypothetical protein